jgi:hypothetical protein
MIACAPQWSVAAATHGNFAAGSNPVSRFANWHKNCSMHSNVVAFLINNYSSGINHA